jgi:hypothetical protein
LFPANDSFLLQFLPEVGYVCNGWRIGEMGFTRRDFIKFGGIAAVSTIGLSGQVFAAKGGADLAHLNGDAFRGLIGTEFVVSTAEVSVSATLSEVRDFTKPSKKGECFLLVFDARAERVEQATYSVFHPQIGNFDLFLTEGKTKHGPTLMAVINRI